MLALPPFFSKRYNRFCFQLEYIFSKHAFLIYYWISIIPVRGLILYLYDCVFFFFVTYWVRSKQAFVWMLLYCCKCMLLYFRLDLLLSFVVQTTTPLFRKLLTTKGLKYYKFCPAAFFYNSCSAWLLCHIFCDIKYDFVIFFIWPNDISDCFFVIFYNQK